MEGIKTTEPEDRRKRYGSIQERANFSKLPGGINMLRVGEILISKHIWLVCSFDPETKESATELAFLSNAKAQDAARELVGRGKYISLKSMEIRDAG